MLFWLMSLFACQPNPCERGSEPTLMVGTGLDHFEPMTEMVELIHGPQGGYHILIGLEGTFLAAQTFIGGDFSANVDGEEVARTRPWLEFTCSAEQTTQQTWGNPLILDGDPNTVVDKDVQIIVHLIDTESRRIDASALVRVVNTVDELAP